MIVVPAVMEDQVQYAVDDLRSYLQKITDLKLELAQGDAAGKFGIFVGDVPANDDLKPVVEKGQLGREGFVLDISPQGVRIVGGSKFGTAYGVYELLERLGVRWLFPGEWGDVVPRAVTVSLPAGRFTDKPGFMIRRMAVNYSYDPCFTCMTANCIPRWRPRAEPIFVRWPTPSAIGSAATGRTPPVSSGIRT